MKPVNLVIAFDKLEQLDTLLNWAYKQGLDWAVAGYREKARVETLERARDTFKQKDKSHAILVDEHSVLYQSPLNYFKNDSTYRNCEFTNADNLLIGIDCTIPE